MEIEAITTIGNVFPKVLFEDIAYSNYVSFKELFSSNTTNTIGVISNTMQGGYYPSIGWEWSLANLKRWNPIHWAGNVDQAMLQTMFPDLGWDIEVLDGYKRFILIIDNFSVTMFMVSL
jgi:hypothetical protein